MTSQRHSSRMCQLPGYGEIASESWSKTSINQDAHIIETNYDIKFTSGRDQGRVRSNLWNKRLCQKSNGATPVWNTSTYHH